jgi:hypothetical protein
MKMSGKFMPSKKSKSSKKGGSMKKRYTVLRKIMFINHTDITIPNFPGQASMATDDGGDPGDIHVFSMGDVTLNVLNAKVFKLAPVYETAKQQEEWDPAIQPHKSM